MVRYALLTAFGQDRPGIVVFMGVNHSAGVHTEIWTGSDFHQAIMKGFFSSLEKSAPVWFWEVRLDASS